MESISSRYKKRWESDRDAIDSLFRGGVFKNDRVECIGMPMENIPDYVRHCEIPASCRCQCPYIKFGCVGCSPSPIDSLLASLKRLSKIEVVFSKDLLNP